MTILGIDPGLDGALAVLDGETVRLCDTPTCRTASGSTLVDEMACILLRPYAGRAHAVLEAVSGRPGQGTASARSIGPRVRALAGVPGGPGDRAGVMPAVWKRALGLTGADKSASRGRAQALFPQVRGDLQRVKDHGRAEALLLAEWARRRQGRGA